MFTGTPPVKPNRRRTTAGRRAGAGTVSQDSELPFVSPATNYSYGSNVVNRPKAPRLSETKVPLNVGLAQKLEEVQARHKAEEEERQRIEEEERRKAERERPKTVEPEPLPIPEPEPEILMDEEEEEAEQAERISMPPPPLPRQTRSRSRSLQPSEGPPSRRSGTRSRKHSETPDESRTGSGTELSDLTGFDDTMSRTYSNDLSMMSQFQDRKVREYTPERDTDDESNPGLNVQLETVEEEEQENFDIDVDPTSDDDDVLTPSEDDDDDDFQPIKSTRRRTRLTKTLQVQEPNVQTRRSPRKPLPRGPKRFIEEEEDKTTIFPLAAGSDDGIRSRSGGGGGGAAAAAGAGPGAGRGWADGPGAGHGVGRGRGAGRGGGGGGPGGGEPPHDPPGPPEEDWMRAEEFSARAYIINTQPLMAELIKRLRAFGPFLMWLGLLWVMAWLLLIGLAYVPADKLDTGLGDRLSTGFGGGFGSKFGSKFGSSFGTGIGNIASSAGGWFGSIRLPGGRKYSVPAELPTNWDELLTRLANLERQVQTMDGKYDNELQRLDGRYDKEVRSLDGKWDKQFSYLSKDSEFVTSSLASLSSGSYQQFKTANADASKTSASLSSLSATLAAQVSALAEQSAEHKKHKKGTDADHLMLLEHDKLLREYKYLIAAKAQKADVDKQLQNLARLIDAKVAVTKFEREFKGLDKKIESQINMKVLERLAKMENPKYWQEEMEKLLRDALPKQVAAEERQGVVELTPTITDAIEDYFRSNFPRSFSDEVAKMGLASRSEIPTYVKQALPKSWDKFYKDNEKAIRSAAPSKTSVIVTKDTVMELVQDNLDSKFKTWVASDFNPFRSEITTLRQKLEDMARTQRSAKPATTTVYVDNKGNGKDGKSAPPPPPPPQQDPTDFTKYASDFKMRDFAAFGVGARIWYHITSPTLEKVRNPFQRAYQKMIKETDYNQPAIATLPTFDVGDCWPFAGSEGDLAIRLAEPIAVTHVTYEHIPKNLAHNPGSAPRLIEIWGRPTRNDTRDLLEELAVIEANTTGDVTPESRVLTSPMDIRYGRPKGPEFVKLATWEFEFDEGHHYQTERIAVDMVNLGALVDVVVFRVRENYGDSHTCLYRTRVHGYPKSAINVEES